MARSERGIEIRKNAAIMWEETNREKRNEQRLQSYYRHRSKRRLERRTDYAKDPHKYRRWQLWSTYRLTPERYQELFDKQNGCCPCGHVFHIGSRNRMGACVDHDHKCCPGNKSCGRCVRGLLCRNCNRALGLLKDSPELLKNLAAWLEVMPSQEL